MLAVPSVMIHEEAGRGMSLEAFVYRFDFIPGARD
jgi:hypothetical protein